jgi:3-hydroxyisobutyrate dehydrogenase-like beta-hydroxyacid dehydrogenase
MTNTEKRSAIKLAESRESVGVIGLGAIGRPVAMNLAETGFDIHVFDIDRLKVSGLCEHATVTVHDSIASLAQNTSAVILLTPNGASALSSVCGRQSHPGIIESAAPGYLVIDMGSSGLEETLTMHESLAERGISFVDAPISKGVKGAVERNLTVMMGGSVDAVSRAKRIIDCLASHLFHLGPVGAGQIVKALNNFLSATTFMATCEVSPSHRPTELTRRNYWRS